MRKRTKIMLVGLAVLLSVSATLTTSRVLIAAGRSFEAAGIERAVAQAFAFEGDYVMSDDKRRWWPRGFENLNAIHLGGDTKSANGYVEANHGNTKFKFIAISVSREKVTFTTRAIQGISYKFEGKFLVDDPAQAPEAPKEILDRVVLEGALVKLQGSKQIASANVRLLYSPGGD